MNVEVAHKLTEREEREANDKRRWQELAEIGEVIILAIVAVATAWSGYQAAKWDGRRGSSTAVHRVSAYKLMRPTRSEDNNGCWTFPRSIHGSKRMKRATSAWRICTSDG